MPTDLLAPIITGAFLLVVGVVAEVMRRRTAKNGTRDSKMPDVVESWEEAERARANMRMFEDLFYLVRGGFRGYVRRQKAGGSSELTPDEQLAYDARSPTETRQ